MLVWDNVNINKASFDIGVKKCFYLSFLIVKIIFNQSRCLLGKNWEFWKRFQRLFRAKHKYFRICLLRF
jgi:hypothetical protein